MKKEPDIHADPDGPGEYDLSNGVRGKYAALYAGGTNIVVLEPDVAQSFPDSQSVNEAWRALIKVARRTTAKAPEQ